MERHISILKIVALKSEVAEELEKIRSSNFSIIGENKVLAYYSFRALMASNLILKKAQASMALGQNIPKQVYSKAKKVAEYVINATPYEHEGEKIVLKESDFSTEASQNNGRDVMQTYGHIAASERHGTEKVLDKLNSEYRDDEKEENDTLKDMKSEFLADPKNKAAYDELTPEYAVASAMIKARAEAGLTQAELAKKAGMTQAQVSRLESGQWPTPATIEKLARALGKRAELRFV